jgi:hypothetical protein
MLTIGEPDFVAEAKGMFGQPAPLCLQPLQPPYTWAAAANYETPTKSRTRRAVLLLVQSILFRSLCMMFWHFKTASSNPPLSALATAGLQHRSFYLRHQAACDAAASGVCPKKLAKT